MIQYIPGILAIGLNAVFLVNNLLRMDYSFENIAVMVLQAAICILLVVLWYNIWRMNDRNSRREMRAVEDLDLTRTPSTGIVTTENVIPLERVRAKPQRYWYRELTPGSIEEKLYPDIARRKYEGSINDMRRQRLRLLELASRQGYMVNNGRLLSDYQSDYANLPWRY